LYYYLIFSPDYQLILLSVIPVEEFENPQYENIRKISEDHSYSDDFYPHDRINRLL
jgi:hypothetical protein